MTDYFEELYECKKKLINELFVIRKIREALSYSVIDLDMEIKDLDEEIKSMEVDLKETQTLDSTSGGEE